jgi:nucleotide-binding universal stress UspA family protein
VEPPSGNLVRILIAVDSTDESHHVASVARGLFPDDEHVVLTAASSAPYPLGDQVAGVDYHATTDQLRASDDDADGAVLAAQAILGDDDDAAAIVTLGVPGVAICREALAVGADLVVVGHRAKGWISRLFDPSVSDYVVRNAPCPVLVIRESDE